MAKSKAQNKKAGLGRWIKGLFVIYWLSFSFLVVVTVAGASGPLIRDSFADANSNAVGDLTGGIGGVDQAPGGGVSFDTYVCDILIPTAGYLVGGLTVLMIILAGVVYTTSQGQASGDLSIGTAKQMITAALTGALLYMMGYFLLGECGINGGAGGILQQFIRG